MLLVDILNISEYTVNGNGLGCIAPSCFAVEMVTDMWQTKHDMVIVRYFSPGFNLTGSPTSSPCFDLRGSEGVEEAVWKAGRRSAAQRPNWKSRDPSWRCEVGQQLQRNWEGQDCKAKISSIRIYECWFTWILAPFDEFWFESSI